MFVKEYSIDVLIHTSIDRFSVINAPHPIMQCGCMIDDSSVYVMEKYAWWGYEIMRFPVKYVQT